MQQAKKTHKNIMPKIILCALVLALTVFALFGCGRFGGSSNPPDKTTLAENAASGGDYDYVAKYLDEWDFPRFDKSKMTSVEDRVASTSVIAYPEKAEHARLTAEYFLESYYDSINIKDTDEVTDALLRSYLATSGDIYAKYRSAEEYAAYLEKTSGEFVGIGITFTKSEGRITILKVLEGSEAEAAGLRTGDEIISIDGIAATGCTTDEVSALILGEVGSKISITVMRDGTEITLTAKRAVIEEKSVIFEERILAYEKEAGSPLYLSVGYVKITAFRKNTAEQFKTAINELERIGVQGFIFDVRDNGGGYLSSVVSMLDYLVPIDTKLVSYKYKSAADTIERSEIQHAISVPVAVIINENTASAAEVFASAIRDYASLNVLNSFLVGKTSFGKGIMQTAYTFSDGSAFHITSANILPPLGESYHGIGITPTYEAELGEDGEDGQYDLAAKRLAQLMAVYANGLSKEHLIEFLTKKMNEDDGKQYDYVSDYLKVWNAPLFDEAKMRSLQRHYVSRVGGISDVRELAKSTVLLFASKYYIDTNVTDVTATTDSLIRAWVDTLGDRWAEYRNPEEYESFIKELNGETVGIGITIDPANHLITKIARSSDAFGRLLVGDLLVAVDGIEFIFETDTSAGNYNLISALISGEPGSTVDITVLRDGEEISLTVTRSEEDSETVLVDVSDDGIAYVEIISFKATTESQFKEAISSLMKENIRGLILDLRGNIGGTLNSVVTSISCLVGNGGTPIISFEFFNGDTMSPIKTSGSSSIGKLPVILLCDKYTASAGELFCAALRDYTAMGLMNVTLIGEVTEGKAILQETQKLSDGSSITLTIANFYPPLGKDTSFVGTGITPDFIESDRELQEELAIRELLKMIEDYESSLENTPE